MYSKQNRVTRGPPGSYHNQHGGYRPSGPHQQWGPPSAPPPSYGGYSQATQYPGPQQYQGPPQAYGAYSQQPSSGYASSGWDRRTPSTAAQPVPQGSYDYYAQQGQQVFLCKEMSSELLSANVQLVLQQLCSFCSLCTCHGEHYQHLSIDLSLYDD